MDRPTPSTPSSTGNSMSSAPSSTDFCTNNSTPSSSCSTSTYNYGVDILAALAIGISVYFAYSKKAG